MPNPNNSDSPSAPADRVDTPAAVGRRTQQRGVSTAGRRQSGSTAPRQLRRIAIGAVLVALIAAAFWPSARLVDTVPVDIGTVRETLDAEGRTRVRDRYLITAPVAAMARRQTLEPGDAVAVGQVVAVLDPVASPTLDARSRAEAEARLAAYGDRHAAAREEARAAAAEAEQARSEAQRLAALLARGLVAAEVAERARTAQLKAEREAASARFRVATAQHEEQAARAILQRNGVSAAGEPALELIAPVAGVVLRRQLESARAVQAGEALLEIGDPDAMEIEVDVLSADAVRLREGMAVELLRWGGEAPLDGRVRRIEPGGFTKFSALGVEEQRVWVIVDLTSPREDWLRLGEAYRVNARFIINQIDDTLRAPASAIFRQTDSQAAFRIEGSRARLIPIHTGLRGGGLVQILDGLSPGDRLIAHPDRELSDGDRVRSR